MATIVLALTVSMTQAQVEAVRPATIEPQAAVPGQLPEFAATPLSRQETHPELKNVASAVAVGLATFDPHETVAEVAARLPPEAAAFAGALHQPGNRSRSRVVYPQLGGLQAESASVMVVLEQVIGSAEGTSSQIRTLDIRLRREGGQWRFEHLASIGGDAPSSLPVLPVEALEVLGDARIELPDSARWDIIAGRVSPVLLRLMTQLAEQTPYGVVTLSSGHPWEIFGTPRQSDHTKGLAMDIYRLGDKRVIDDRVQGSFTYGITGWLYAQPQVARIGSPWALDGFGGRSFTDALHQDHLHVAVSPDLLAGNAPDR